MIGYLRGILKEKTPDSLILEVAGVGYEVTVPASSFCVLPRQGAEGNLYIHTYVREDALRLFGFASLFDRRVFELLISVSSVGPRLALALLGPLNGVEVCQAVVRGDVTLLTSVPGVGARTAERLVLELRPKVQKLMASRGDFGAVLAAPDVRAAAGSIFADMEAPAEQFDVGQLRERAADEIRAALVNLGYKDKQVNEAWKTYEKTLSPLADVIVEDALRAILRRLSGHLASASV